MINSHTHLRDIGHLDYPWLNGVPAIHRTFLPADCDAARGTADIAAMVFVQCECRPGLTSNRGARNTAQRKK